VALENVTESSKSSAAKSDFVISAIILEKELPNIVSLLHEMLSDRPWADFLSGWESIIFSILIALFTIVTFQWGIRKREMIPQRLQNFFELLAELLTNHLYGIIGPEGKKYVPFLGTIFIYILSLNLFGLIPLMKSPSVSLNVTIAMATCVFALVQYLNIKNMGVMGFLYHLAGSPKTGIGWAMVPLMFPLELLTQISRPVTLSLRLFGNIMGEDVLIAYFTLLGVALFGLMNLPIAAGIPLQIPFMFLAILTSLMQAMVFTLLAAVYIMLSMPHHTDTHTKN
jgi:F-type H+-transporting ATPase subunit a